jgi:hypothetical protein
MKSKSKLISAGIVTTLAALLTEAAISTKSRHTVKVPGGLAFSEFMGYERWQTISISENGGLLATRHVRRRH